ncbi:hypothetical protein LSH36_131g00043 [Paralvinella palmiformis]|uniref:Phospholipid scramblase n=1 Tax=Paralvinella palmiformis TaxID=53620 RepID=A0AAD9JWA4_9ANNE|nr:hypothetical protein LSH36_131g00043 [Paralvinella palmiformis]
MSYENTFIYGVHTTDMDVPLDNVTQQPGKQVSTHMVKPEVPGGCPAGLEYLSTIDQVICKQETHLLEVFCPWEKNNRFRVYNTMGQQVYIIEEGENYSTALLLLLSLSLTQRGRERERERETIFIFNAIHILL